MGAKCPDHDDLTPSEYRALMRAWEWREYRTEMRFARDLALKLGTTPDKLVEEPEEDLDEEELAEREELQNENLNRLFRAVAADLNATKKT